MPAYRDLPKSEFRGWAIKVGLTDRCQAVIDGDSPDQVKGLARTASDANKDDLLTSLYAADVLAIGGGLLAAGVVSQDEYDSLVALLDPVAPTVAAAITARESEVAHYQLNIDNYTAVLAKMAADGVPAEWPAELERHRATPPDDLSDDVFEAVSALQFRDRVRKLLRSERAEQAKAAAVLVALKVRG